MEHTRIIISDLHVGQNDNFDIFATPGSNKHTLFTEFLNFLRDQTNPIELVINGDFIDFLQLRPWNDLSRQAALQKIKDIVAKSPTVFSGLGNFLKDSRHRLKILPGNHDVELAYPEVGQVLRNAILQTVPDANDRFDLFGPPSATRTTYRPKINGILIQIEHGNEGDPFNSLNYTKLFNDAETDTEEFAYPPGTELVYDIMNGFKEKFNFVDVLKPEMPAVPIILLALKPVMAARGIPGTTINLLGTVGNWIDSILRRKFAGQPLGPIDSKPSAEEQASDADAALEILLAKTFPDKEHPTIYEMESFLSNDVIPGSHAATLSLMSWVGSTSKKIRVWLLSYALQALVRFQAVNQGEDFFKKDHPDDRVAKGAKKPPQRRCQSRGLWTYT